MKRMHKGIVIGGGIGGLVTAILLAARGMDITLIDRNPTLGGKLQDIELGDFRFDFGPSTITMPWIFEKVFTEIGEPLDPMLKFIPCEINSRNFFADGTTVDLSNHQEAMEKQLASFSQTNRKGFQRYVNEVTKMYRYAEEHFFSRSFSEWTDFFSPQVAHALMQVHPFTTIDAFHRSFFDDARLVAMMNRYATYVGSSPYQTPATIAMIAYLELVKGVYRIQGGNYQLIHALVRLAQKKGVQLISQSAVEQITVDSQRVTGVLLGNTPLQADFVISNVDYYATQLHLLPPEARVLTQSFAQLQKKVPFSSSGFLIMAGVNRIYPQLEHHNVFFPDSYGKEFQEIFAERQFPNQPAIYICNSSFHEPERGNHGKGSNLYILMNVPPTFEEQPHLMNGTRLETHTYHMQRYQSKVIELLEHQWGLTGLSSHIVISRQFDQSEIARLSGALAGALYGAASHSLRRTFFRPTLKDKKVTGLYYVGGSTHPGGGTPMVTISGFQTAKKILSDFQFI